MPRLTPITTRDQVPEEGRDAFDRVIASRGSVNAPQSMLLYVPELSALATAMNDALRWGSTLSDADVELAILVAARQFDIAYVWGQHVRRAAEAGVDDALITAIGEGGELPPTNARASVIVRFGRELVGRHRMDDALFDEARRELGERGVVELMALLGYYLMIGCALIGTGYEPAPGAPALPPR